MVVKVVPFVTIDMNNSSVSKFWHKWLAIVVKAGPDVLEGVHDLRAVGSWHLKTKIIAREGKDFKLLILVLVNEFVQCSVLIGEASEGGCVDYQ